MNSAKIILSASATAIIIADGLLILFSCLFLDNFSFLLLIGLTTLICLLFCFVFTVYLREEVHTVTLHQWRFLASLLILIIHFLVIIISSVSSLRLASYALGVDSLILLAFLFYIQKLRSGTVIPDTKNPLQVQIEEALKPRKFDIKELIAATNDFNHVSDKSSYYMLYYGTLPNGTAIAILRLSSPKDRDSFSAFVNEISSVSVYKHDNIMRLLGYCLTPKYVYFVHEFMVNCRVKDWIFSEDTSKRRSFTIARRYQVGLEFSKALDYLYNHCSNYQVDISPSNILLDERFKARVVNYGLWRYLGERKKSVKSVTTNYPVDGKSIEKSKVYRYGVLILELVSGKRHWRWCEDGEIVNMLYWKLKEGKVLELVDEVLEMNEGDGEKVEVLVSVALLCVQQRAENRPSIAQVVSMLLGKEKVPLVDDIPLGPVEPNYDVSIVAHNYSSYSDE